MRYFLLLFGATIFLSSCSTKFDVNAPYQDVTILYALLNPHEATQYVRIEKGFLDASKSALTLAQIPDSIYYGDILTVTLQATSGTDTTPIHLTRTINLPKDSGTFASAPNILYETNHRIDPLKKYLLTVKNNNSGKIITSVTSVVQDFRVIHPASDSALSPNLDLSGFDQFGNPTTTEISFVSATNGRIYSLAIRFHYLEWDVRTPSVKDTFYVDWPIYNDKTSLDSSGGEQIKYNLIGRQFLNFIASGVIKKDSTKHRDFLGRPLEFMFTAGGTNLYDYIRVSQAQNGITQLQAQVKYTNINGGLGIFSSRSDTSVRNVGINAASRDTIACSPLTRDLNFELHGTSCYP